MGHLSCSPICSSSYSLVFSPALDKQKKPTVDAEDVVTFLKLRSPNRTTVAFVLLLVLSQPASLMVYAQNMGALPQINKAVQGQTAAQPEGAFLNLVNWVGNVIAPVGAALCVVMAIISYTNGRGVARWAIAAGGLLMISGLTRLIEFWIQQGQAGIQ